MPTSAPKLVKEVQPPQRYDSGVGVLVVASAAVFMALLGSSMVLRARAACRLAKPVVAPAVAPMAPAAQAPAAGPAEVAEPCGEPVFRQTADGTLHIEYTVCPASAPAHTEAAATRLPADLQLRY